MPDVVIKMDGGLGAQIITYAAGHGIVRASLREVAYDMRWYKTHGKDWQDREDRSFILTKVFEGLPFKEASINDIEECKKAYNFKLDLQRKLYPEVFTSCSKMYIEMLPFNAKYLEYIGEDLKKDFKFNLDYLRSTDKELATLAKIKRAPNAAAVHIRRGDYVGSFMDVTTPQYFRRAIEYIDARTSGAEFFIFSNDIEYAKAALENNNKRTKNFTYVENRGEACPGIDLLLMSNCRHFVASNSLFSWSAVWLGEKDGTLTAVPDVWFGKDAPAWIRAFEGIMWHERCAVLGV